jgi:tetratricopeptide (TPR) repeat protein
VAQELENELAVRPQIPLNLIAEHYAKDSAPGRAIKLWRQAAARSMARSAHHEAASMLERALELLPELDESPPRTELELELTAESAVALRSIRGYAAPEVEERYLRARALSGEVDAPHIEFNVDWGLFQCNLVKGDLARAGEYAERLRVSAEALPDRFRVDANLAIGMVKLHQGAFERAREALERSLILTDPLRDDPHLLTHGQNPGIFCRSNLAHTLAFIGHAAEARNLAQENLSIARSRQSEPSHIYTYVNALAFASRVYVVLREPAAVYRISDELVQIARNNRYSYYEAIGHAQIGWVRASEAKDRTQIEGFAEKIGTLEATGTELAVRGFYAQLAELYAELGDKDAACSALERTTGGSGTRTWDVELERVRGLIAALEPMSDPELAEAAFKSSLDCARAQRSGTQELRTSVSYSLFLVRHERIEEARQLIDACLSRLSECRDIADAAKARQVLQQIGLQAGD